MQKAKFGPAGNSEAFYEAGFKSSLDMPKWLKSIGLDAYEYQCGKGILIKDDTASKLGDQARNNDISMSLHAPYFINPATDDAQKKENGLNYVFNSASIANAMGATRIVVHTGACAKMDRTVALEYAKGFFKDAINITKNSPLEEIFICPETMGKINQLGDLYEVLEICSMDDRLIPTIDFGHLNSRTHGGLNTYEQFSNLLDIIENKLGADRLACFHAHFSHIEYTAGGEKKHLTFEDEVYGPFFAPLAELIYKKSLHPTIICESAGTQSDDALSMKKMYESAGLS